MLNRLNQLKSEIMSFSDIPAELQAIPHWVCWRSEDIGARKNTKVPYDPKSNNPASVNDPNTWSDFNTAITKAEQGSYSGIGFVFSNDDPYTFIDLDDPSHLSNGEVNPNHQTDLNRQIKIYQEFDSYAEISPSGSGLHIIVRGSIPSGRRRSFIELYSSGRYATFTGNVYNDKPIIEQQEKLTQLYEQMGTGGIATTLYQGDQNETTPDSKIIEQALNATNGDKFKRLLDGDWTGLYPSQSEADFAFVDIVAFYSRNKSQIIRLFQQSKLGERAKAKRIDYVNWMVNKSFDNMLPPIDFDGFKNAVEAKIAQKQLPSIKLLKAKVEVPPGLLGELAQYIYTAAIRPVPEIAMAAAIGLMAGVCGRAYNVWGTGLNQYIMVLAKTGRGKEAAASGIDKIINEARKQVPTVDRFRGPGVINSGQALVKYLAKSNCFVSVLGEFGITLERISARNANGADKMLYSTLLDLYSKSGFGQTFQPSIYSKQEDNVSISHSPCVSILGESTPKIFYEVLNEDMISAGLLPRFLIIEYDGERVDTNEDHYRNAPPQTLINKFAALVANVENIMHRQPSTVIDIKIAPDALEMLRDFDKYSTKQINSGTDDIITELWNRAHIKVLRLSALVAVGVHPYEPCITTEFVTWAISLIQPDIKALSARFSTGEIGKNTNEIRQLNDIISNIKSYCMESWEKVAPYCSKSCIKLHSDKIVPYEFFSTKTSRLSSFKNDNRANGGNGATYAIKRALQTLIDSGQLVEVNTRDLKFTGAYGGYHGRAFSPTPKFPFS